MLHGSGKLDVAVLIRCVWRLAGKRAERVRSTNDGIVIAGMLLIGKGTKGLCSTRKSNISRKGVVGISDVDSPGIMERKAGSRGEVNNSSGQGIRNNLSAMELKLASIGVGGGKNTARKCLSVEVKSASGVGNIARHGYS